MGTKLVKTYEKDEALIRSFPQMGPPISMGPTTPVVHTPGGGPIGVGQVR